MPIDLKTTIERAASDFALQIVKAVQGATLQDIVAIQSGTKVGRRGRPFKAAGGKRGVKAPAKKKRVVKNYPKCAYPGCGKNRFVRGKGFCGKHWKMWLEKKIKDASHYKNEKK